MRLATIPATPWLAPEPRSRIVLYAWYQPSGGMEDDDLEAVAEARRRDDDCTPPLDRGGPRPP